MKDTECMLSHRKCESIAMDLRLIDWKHVIYNVDRLRARIAKARARGNRRAERHLRYLLATSPSIKLLKLRQEIRGPQSSQ